MKDWNAMSDDEVVEAVAKRKITFERELSKAEATSYVRGSVTVYNGTDGERCIRYVSPEGWRFIRLADITKISRRTYKD